MTAAERQAARAVPLNDNYGAFCIVDAAGCLIEDDRRDQVFRYKKDALLELSEEERFDGYHVVPCKVIPR